ncbi:hypothetical protein [Corynebacterium sp. 335C]
MTLSSAIRRGALATVAAGAAVALTACSAGQLTQTADQVAAVDGARNSSEAVPGGVAVRDSQVVFDDSEANAGAALKFTAVNQERSGEVYTLDSVNVEGIGDVQLTRVAETPTYAAAAQGEGAILPRDCSIVVDSPRSIETMTPMADQNPACIAWFTAEIPADTIVGVDGNAAALNRNVTYSFSSNEGDKQEFTLYSPISAFIPQAGLTDRTNEDAETRGLADVPEEAASPIARTRGESEEVLEGVPSDESKGLKTGYSLNN